MSDSYESQSNEICMILALDAREHFGKLQLNKSAPWGVYKPIEYSKNLALSKGQGLGTWNDHRMLQPVPASSKE
jgi:hypothetical protein